MGKRLLFGFLVVVLALAIVEIAGYCHWLAGAEKTHYDIWPKVAGRRLAADRVILASSLVIDEHRTSKVLLPHQDYYFPLPHPLDEIGFPNFYADPDGVLRRSIIALSDAEGEIWFPFAALRSAWEANQSLAIVSQPPASGGFVGPLGKLTYCHPPSKARGGNLLFWDPFHGPVCELVPC